MFTEKVSFEVAQAEVGKWLDKKRVTPSKRETLAAHISLLIEHLMYGNIVINDDGTIEHTLQFPVSDTEGSLHFDKLTYKARLLVHDLNTKLKSVKAGDGDGRVTAYISALTGRGTGDLGKLDTADAAIAEAIMIFFT